MNQKSITLLQPRRLERPNIRIVTVIAVVALALSLYTVYPRHSLLPEAHGALVQVSLIGNVNGWNYSQPSGNNPTIVLHYGDYADMKFTSTDVTHSFYVDGYNNTTPDCNQGVPYDACSGPISPGPGNLLGFQVAYEPGNYSYFCANHPATMHGIFRVLPYGSDFFLSTRSLTLTVRQGSSVASSVLVKGYNNVAGTVNLLASNPPLGLSASMTPSAVSIPTNGTATSVLNITASSSMTPGVYWQWVDGYNSSITHSFRMTITVLGIPDFAISSIPSSITLVQGYSATSTISLTSLSGFSGKLNITDTVSSPGLAASQNPSTVTANSWSSATSVLTISTSPETSLGNYTVTVKATNSTGQPNHSLQVNVQVKAPPSTSPPSPFLGLSTFIFEAVAAAIGAIAAVLFLARRRAGKKPATPPSSF